MGTLTCEISSITYQVKNDRSIIADKTLEVRGLLTITIVDLAGTATFQRGQPIVVSDSITGPFYEGFIQVDQRAKYGPASTAVDHVLTCFDKKYYFDKGANTTNYEGWYAGDIVVDIVQSGQPGQEGATVAAGLHRDSTVAAFATGTLSGVAPTTNDGGDGDLELSPAGTAVTYSEQTTSDFASGGSLTNCTATNNTLVPTPTNTLKMVAVQALAGTNSTSAVTSVKIWSGAQTINANGGTWLEYDIFIDPASPEAKFSVDIIFSDGTSFADNATVGFNAVTGGANEDGQFILPNASNDLSGLATGAWYSRGMQPNFTTSAKTISAVTLVCKGTRPGTYTAYFKNIKLAVGNTATFFGGTLNVNPPQQLQVYGFSSTSVTIVPAYDLYSATAPTYGATAYKTTSAISIDAVKLLRTSFLSWVAIIPDKCALVVKYSLDGTSFTVCTNGAPLPNLPAGLDVSGKSIYLQYEFYYLQGALPDSLIQLEEVNLTLLPSYAATKTDITYSVLSQANWNAGTLTNLLANTNGELTLNGIIRTWDDGSNANQSFYTTNLNGFNQTVNNRSFTIWNTPVGPVDARSRFDFAGTWQNFTAEIDLKFDDVDLEYGLVYRTTNWQNNNNTYAYVVFVWSGGVELGKGSNSLSGTGSYTVIGDGNQTLATGIWHRLKLVISGNSHQIFLDGVRVINATDSTYSAAGYIGARVYNNGTNQQQTSYFDNFGVVSTLSGTWVSPATSLTSVGNYGNGIVTWRDKSLSYNGLTNTSALVEVTYNGGSTWAACTNGAPLPGLTVGQALSGVNMQFRVTLATSSASSLAAIDNLVVRVLGQYSATGTRSTAPLGIDYVDRANQSGFGTASDGQTWAPTGTGTPAVNGNTLQISGTTGDFIELLGSRTGGDMDETVAFKLSSIVGGLILRYADSTHYYKLSASTTVLSIIKRYGGTITQLGAATVTLSNSTLYYLRYRIVGSGPINFYGKVWLAGTLEPGNWTVTATE